MAAALLAYHARTGELCVWFEGRGGGLDLYASGARGRKEGGGDTGVCDKW